MLSQSMARQVSPSVTLGTKVQCGFGGWIGSSHGRFKGRTDELPRDKHNGSSFLIHYERSIDIVFSDTVDEMTSIMTTKRAIVTQVVFNAVQWLVDVVSSWTHSRRTSRSSCTAQQIFMGQIQLAQTKTCRVVWNRANALWPLWIK